MLRKVVIGCLLSSCAVISTHVSADNHTISLGYAQSKVPDFKSIRGVNAQYRYEWDSPVSVMGSLTYMTGDDSYSLRENFSGYDGKVAMKYYSMLAGPAYRVNDYVSLYVLAGIAHMKVADKVTYLTQYSESDKENRTSAAYGAGVIFNPMKNLSVNIGYEGTYINDNGTISINGFNIGAGYRF